MQSISANQTNKEIEDFIEGDYISIKEGESRVLEFDMSKMRNHSINMQTKYV